MSKINLKLLLAIVVGVIKVVISVLSDGVPEDIDGNLTD